ncbi:uncharacterized protein ACB058_019568 isoform 1-T1 [Synchiropus picturatus]
MTLSLVVKPGRPSTCMRRFHVLMAAVMGGTVAVVTNWELTLSDTHSGGDQRSEMLLTLALLALLVSPVLPLQCYVCSSSTTNEACNANTQECTPPLDTCMTIVDTLGSATAIVKQCASLTTCRAAASSSSVDANGNGNSVNCCNSFNLCNFSGAEQLHGFSLLLVLTVALLLLLLLQH